MSTNCAVAVVMKDGSVLEVYGHWDGYVVGGVGQMLFENYNTQEKAEELVEMGDFSVLCEKLHPTGPHSFNHPEKGVSVFYGRDREMETDSAPNQYSDLEEYRAYADDQEFNYLFVNGEWIVNFDGDEESVKNVLTNKLIPV